MIFMHLPTDASIIRFMKQEELMAAGTRLGRWMFFGVIAVIALWFVGALAMPWLQQYRSGTGPVGRFPRR